MELLKKIAYARFGDGVAAGDVTKRLREELLTFQRQQGTRPTITKSAIMQWFSGEVEGPKRQSAKKFLWQYLTWVSAKRLVPQERQPDLDELELLLRSYSGGLRNTDIQEPQKWRATSSRGRSNDLEERRQTNQDYMFSYFENEGLTAESCEKFCAALSGRYYAFRLKNKDEIIQIMVDIHKYDAWNKVPHFRSTMKNGNGGIRTAGGHIVDFGTSIALFGFIDGDGSGPIKWTGTTDIILERGVRLEDMKELLGVYMTKTSGIDYKFGRIGVVRCEDANENETGVWPIGKVIKNRRIFGCFDVDQLCVTVGNRKHYGFVDGKLGKLW